MIKYLGGSFQASGSCSRACWFCSLAFRSWHGAWASRVAGRNRKGKRIAAPYRSAVLALLGLLLGFSFAVAGSRHEHAVNSWLRRQTQSAPLLSGRNFYLSHTVQRLSNCCASMFRCGSRRTERGNFRINLQRRANAAPSFRTTCGPRPSLLPQKSHRRSLPVSLRASTKPSTWKPPASPQSVITSQALFGCFCCAWQVAACGWSVASRGMSGRHSILERFVFPILVAVVITLITDIDTPRGGLVTLDERPLLELNETLSRASATTTP